MAWLSELQRRRFHCPGSIDEGPQLLRVAEFYHAEVFFGDKDLWPSDRPKRTGRAGRYGCRNLSIKPPKPFSRDT